MWWWLFSLLQCRAAQAKKTRLCIYAGKIALGRRRSYAVDDDDECERARARTIVDSRTQGTRGAAASSVLTMMQIAVCICGKRLHLRISLTVFHICFVPRYHFSSLSRIDCHWQRNSDIQDDMIVCFLDEVPSVLSFSSSSSSPSSFADRMQEQTLYDWCDNHIDILFFCNIELLCNWGM